MGYSLRIGRCDLKINTGANDIAAVWASEKLQTSFVPPYVAWGIENKDGRMIAAVVFNDYTGTNIEISLAGQGALTRSVLSQIADYCFNQMKCNRISCHTRAGNKFVNSFTSKAGFKVEGLRRKFYGDDDAISWGMLRSDCPWFHVKQREKNNA
jgi:RimJ/RimL family protein N-acetyltransferase